MFTNPDKKNLINFCFSYVLLSFFGSDSVVIKMARLLKRQMRNVVKKVIDGIFL